MRCVLIDDEPKALEILTRYVERSPSLELAGAFRDPVRALEFIASHETDLVFLDVHKSYVVNCRHVSRIERDTVRCADKIIPIGDAYREAFLKALQVP